MAAQMPPEGPSKEQAGLDSSPGPSPAAQWLAQAEKEEGAGYGAAESARPQPAHSAGVQGARWAGAVGGGQGPGAQPCCPEHLFALRLGTGNTARTRPHETLPLPLNKARVL